MQIGIFSKDSPRWGGAPPGAGSKNFPGWRPRRGRANKKIAGAKALPGAGSENFSRAKSPPGARPPRSPGKIRISKKF